MKKYGISKLTFFIILSWALCYVTFISLMVAGYIHYMGAESSQTMVEFEEKFGSYAADYVNKAKTIVITGLVSLIPTIVLSIIVKDKIKPTIWMLNIIISSVLIGSYMMWVIFAMWAIDTYIFNPLINKLKTERIVDNRLLKLGVLRNE